MNGVFTARSANDIIDFPAVVVVIDHNRKHTNFSQTQIDRTSNASFSLLALQNLFSWRLQHEHELSSRNRKRVKEKKKKKQFTVYQFPSPYR